MGWLVVRVWLHGGGRRRLSAAVGAFCVAIGLGLGVGVAKQAPRQPVADRASLVLTPSLVVDWARFVAIVSTSRLAMVKQSSRPGTLSFMLRLSSSTTTWRLPVCSKPPKVKPIKRASKNAARAMSRQRRRSKRSCSMIRRRRLPSSSSEWVLRGRPRGLLGTGGTGRRPRGVIAGAGEIPEAVAPAATADDACGIFGMPAIVLDMVI